ncbi:MAG: crossover junction endodeoxyribonuclease RuvC [Kiloniellaceae bacterium]
MRVIGLDPGLRHTGWGVIEIEANRLRHIANGTLEPDPSADMASRLGVLHRGLCAVLARFAPHEAAVEATLANRNPSSTLKLGMARGVVLMTPGLCGVPVAEYMPTVVKKAVVGTGRAGKEQVAMMVGRLLPGCAPDSADAADALAVAICHGHSAASLRRWAVASGAGRPDVAAALAGHGR